MIPILEHPSIRRQIAPLSVETYHLLGQLGNIPENVELLRGAIVEKMPKSPLHSAVCQRLVREAQVACEPALTARQEQPLTLADSEPEPDLAVVPARADDYESGHPDSALLVAEIAISTEERDTAKADIYAEASVPEYWLILPADRAVTVYRRPSAGRYTESEVVRGDKTLLAVAVPGLEVSLAKLFG